MFTRFLKLLLIMMMAGNMAMERPKPPRSMIETVIHSKPIVVPNETAVKQAAETIPPNAIIHLLS